MSSSVLPAATDAPVDLVRVRAEADWVLANQTPVGALASHWDLARIDPYLGNFGALGLARAADVTGDVRYADAAQAHLEWYVSAMDDSNMVYDHQREGELYLPTTDLDSTDGYAGTFLLAVSELSVPAGDTARAQALHEGVRRAVASLAMTQQPDGMTWAKPDYKAKYLMDQAEAYSGLLGAVQVAELLGDEPLAAEARTRAERLRTGVEGLWQPGSGSYDWALHEDGTRVPSGGAFYPDAASQLWAVAFGLVPPERQRALVDASVNAHPDWVEPGSATTTSTMYWPVVSWALAASGQGPEARTSVAAVLDAADANGRLWPWNTGTSGQAIIALTS
jgi:hypothetical protein